MSQAAGGYCDFPFARLSSVPRWSRWPIAMRMSPAAMIVVAGGLNVHRSSLRLDGDNHHVMFRVQSAIAQVTAHQRTARLDRRFFQL